MSQVILINPPIYFDNNTSYSLDVSTPPLGLLYIAACLERKGISVSVIDAGCLQLSIEDILNIIEKEKAAIVGISAMTPNIQGALQIAKAIRNKFGDNIKIALGGSHISADSNFFYQFPYFDFAVQGEGEITFSNLAQQILNGQDIKGIYQGEITKNLDLIPFPSRHLVDMNLYNKTLSMIATRGCPFNCYYCSRPAISQEYRFRSPENIVKEMDRYYYQCSGHYQFQDDTLTLNKSFSINLCNRLIAWKKKIKWEANTRIDLVDEELISLIAKSGCTMLHFGIESGSERVRREVINKNFSNQQIDNVIRWCKKYKIEMGCYFMIGHPTETEKEIKETMDFVLTRDISILAISIATPFPGSILYNFALQYNIINKDFCYQFASGKLGKGYKGVYPVFIPPQISRETLFDYRKKILKRFYLRPKYIWYRLKTDFLSFKNLKRDIQEGINILLHGSSKRQPYKK